jgi:hypothetical protein
MAEHAHSCIIAIIHNLPIHRLLSMLLDDLKGKNPALRIRMAEYLYFMLKLWYQPSGEEPLGPREGPAIEEHLLHLLQDPKSEARQLARLAFFEYKSLFPARSERPMALFRALESQYQRALLEEEADILAFMRADRPSRSQFPAFRLALQRPSSTLDASRLSRPATGRGQKSPSHNASFASLKAAHSPKAVDNRRQGLKSPSKAEDPRRSPMPAQKIIVVQKRSERSPRGSQKLDLQSLN